MQIQLLKLDLVADINLQNSRREVKFVNSYKEDAMPLMTTIEDNARKTIESISWSLANCRLPKQPESYMKAEKQFQPCE